MRFEGRFPILYSFPLDKQGPDAYNNICKPHRRGNGSRRILQLGTLNVQPGILLGCRVFCGIAPGRDNLCLCSPG